MNFLQRNLFIKLRSENFGTGTNDNLQNAEDCQDDEEPQRHS